MRRAAAALAGAGLGFFAAALARALASYFWPLAALGLLQAALVAGGISALAAALAPAPWRERLRRRQGYVAFAGAAAAVAVIAGTEALSRRLHPGAGLGLHSFPALYLAALALPFSAAGIALASWCDGAGRRRRGWFLAGVGAGVLGASVLAGAQGAAFPPWTGGRLLESAGAESGMVEINIDRGLRRFLVAPEGADLAFSPAPGRKRREILIVGLENGPVLARLLRQPLDRITVFEQDAALVGAVFARWPALAKARAEGRLAVVPGSERWALARRGGRFDLIVLAESASAAAYHSRALSHRRDPRWTVEAFAAYLAHLKPRGRLVVQRTGIGRVVATLRAAASLPAAEFARRIVVLGRGGRIVSECWYSPAGFDSRDAQDTLRRHRNRTGVTLLYDPVEPEGWNFYTPLARGERARGLAFSTPLDLSAALDERPFFDHVERLMLSPRGRALPEELEPLEGPAGLRLLPAADRALWGILLGGLALGAAAVALARRAARPAGEAAHPSPRVLADGIWLGAAAGLLIESFAAWSEWLAPARLAAAAAQAALLAGAGAGWAGIARPSSRRLACAPAAALAAIFGAAGYHALPVAIRLGPTLGAGATIAAGALLGVALGRAAAAVEAGAGATAAAAGLHCGAALAAASLAAVVATLAATHFGYPLLWVLAAVALIAPLLRRRLDAPGAAGAAT